MTKLLFIVLVISCFACHREDNEETHNEEITAKIGSDTTNRQTEIFTEAEAKSIALQTNIAFDATSPLGFELKKALEDPLTDKYFIQIFQQEKLVVHPQDNKMLSVTDSLFSKDPNKDFFYFVVFTKSMNGSDGFYSEALGSSALSYLIRTTEKFAYYFSIGPLLTEDDMRNWAEHVIREIQVSRENEEKEAINELISQLKKNIRIAGKEYSVVIEKFIKYIEEVQKERISAINNLELTACRANV